MIDYGSSNRIGWNGSLSNPSTTQQEKASTEREKDIFESLDKYRTMLKHAKLGKYPLETVSNIYLNLAEILRQMGQLEEAFQIIFEWYTDWSNTCLSQGTNKLINGQLLMEIGNIQFEKCEFKESLKYYTTLYRFLEQNIDMLGSGLIALNLAQINLNKGLCHMHLREYKMAKEYFKRGLGQGGDVVGQPTKTQLFGYLHYNLGCLHYICGEHELAIQALTKAQKNFNTLTTQAHKQQDNHLLLIEIEYHIGCVEAAQKLIPNGMQRIEGAIENLEGVIEGGMGDPFHTEVRLGAYYYTLGAILLRQNKYQRGMRVLSKCYGIWEKYLEESSIQMKSVLQLMAPQSNPTLKY